jgi:hypothetical protein
MKRITFLWALLLICSGALFAKDAKTNGTTIGRVDRSNWQAIACSSEKADDGGGITALYDGKHNTYWHTYYNPNQPPPFWVIIDLGEGGAREFTAFQFYKRFWYNGGYQKNIQIFVSDEPTELEEGVALPDDSGWKFIGEGVQPEDPTKGTGHERGGTYKMLTVATPGSAENQGRYLLFYFPDSFQAYICLSEIFGIGEIEDNLYAGTPYPNAPHPVPGVIEAEDYDRGGEGVGFHWEEGDSRGPDRPGYSEYRFDEEDASPVYIVDGPGEGNRHLGRNDTPGEYLNYTIDVAADGHYDISLSAAADGQKFNEDRFFQLLLDGMPLLRDYDVIPTAKPVNWDNGFYPVSAQGWGVYVDNVVERVYLPAGKHVLRVYGLFDFDKFSITRSYLGLPYKEANTLPLKDEPPFVLQAEDFDEADGYTDMTYHVATPATNTYRPNTTANIAEGPDGGYHLVTGNGDWYSYTINVPKDKFYEFVFSFYGQRAAASNHLVMEVNGEIVEGLTDDIEFPTSYDEPVEIYMPLTLKEGKNIIKVKTNGGNLDKIEIAKGPFSYGGGPFLGVPFIVSADQTLIISARDFDKGGREISFHDTNTNGGSDISKAYRGTEDGTANVQMEYRNGYNPDGSQNITISNSNAGEWLAYSIDVLDAGSYDVLLTLSTSNDSRQNHIEIDDEPYPAIAVRTTGWGTFLDFAAGNNIKLTAGRHTLFVYYHGNFDKIKILKHKDASPYENTPQVIPGILQAWKFDEGSLSYSVSNATVGRENNTIRKDVDVPVGGNEADGYYVDVAEPNTPQFLNYTVDIKQDGYYKVSFKLKSNQSTLEDVGDSKQIIAERFTLVPASNAWHPSLDKDYSRNWYASFVADPNALGEWQEVVFPVMRLYKGIDTLKLTVGNGAISDIKYASFNFELLTDIVDRSNWSVVGYSGLDVNDVIQGAPGGFNTSIEFALNCTIDGDFSSFWHQGSASPNEFPHYIIYDLGCPTEITQLVSFRRQSYPDYAMVEWSGSNELEGHEYWPILGAGAYSNEFQQNGELGLAVDLPQPVKVRYLKFSVPEKGYRGMYTNVLEVFARGKAFEVGPYNGPHTVPGVLQAEDFNTGGEGNAFHAGNPGTNTYRDELVNIAAIDGGYSLVTGTGDWYTYTIELPNPTLDYKYEFVIYGEKASANTLTLQINGITVEGIIDFPSAYGTPTVVPITLLKKGTNTILVKANGGSLDKFEIRTAEYLGTPFFGTAATVPGRIEAEDFDLGGEGIAFHDDGPTNNAIWASYRPEVEGGPYFENFGTGITIGATNAGEWIVYTVEFPETGHYDFTLSVATSNTNRIAGLSIDGKPSDTTTVKSTAWQDFQEFDIKDVFVTAGIHQVYLELVSINIDYFEIKKSTGIENIISVPVGKVYTEGRILNVKEFPASASLVVYNLLGQKIANYKSVNGGVEVYLPSKGIYIVKVQNEGISVTHKVIAK